eukprot:6213180-Pleurochrysis_carterae.AAC.4
MTVRAGRETLIQITTNKCGLGANAGAGAGRACGFGSGALAGGDGHAQAWTRSLGSGARVLREYTFNASPKRQTGHLGKDRGARRRFQVQ